MRVEGDELVYDAVTCAACGAKVREDRARCLRCGERLVVAQLVRARKVPLGIFMTVAVGLTLLAMGVMSRGGTPEAASAAPAVAPVTVAPVTTVDKDEPRLSGVEAPLPVHRQDAEVLNNLGQSLVRSGRAKEAIEHFDKAIALDGSRWTYHFNRARAYADLKDWDSAIAGYREAEALFPDDYVTQFNLGRALLARGDVEEAAAVFGRTVELAPGEPEFYLAHAGALDRAHKTADAAAAYGRYLELDPTTAQAEKIRARIAELQAMAGTPVLTSR